MVTDNTEFSAATPHADQEPVHPPRVVIGDRGAGWIVEAWDRFRAALSQWLVLMVVGCIVLLIVQFVPFVGTLNNLLKPVWIGGLMLACHAQQQGRAVEPRHLFAGFTRNTGTLILCGLVEVLVSLVLVIVILGPVFLQLMHGLLPESPLGTDSLTVLSERLTADPRALLNFIDLYSFLIRCCVLLALLLPLWAATWYAPALIVLGNKPLGEALLLSLTGTMKNVWPFFIYGLLWILLALLIPVTLGLALLVLAPMYYLSIYLGYRDIYLD